MHAKKLTMLTFPVPLEIFFAKHCIQPEEFALAKLLEGIMELGNKLAFDINGELNVNDVLELIAYTGIANYNEFNNTIIMSEFINTINICIYDMLGMMTVHDLLGSVKYVIGVSNYQLAVETYKI